MQPAVKITTAMLDKLHVYETEKIKQHRAQAAAATAAADAIEARGPWPDRGAVIPDGG